jgi:hypothetical protein
MCVQLWPLFGHVRIFRRGGRAAYAGLIATQTQVATWARGQL